MLNANSHGKQIILNGDITIPQNKPGIERVLSATSTIKITHTAVQKKKVVFTGELITDLQYVAIVEGDTQPLHFAAFIVPFADFLEYKGPSSEVEVKGIVEFQEYLPISEKEIKKTVILKIYILGSEEPYVINSVRDAPHPITCFPQAPQCYTNTSNLYPDRSRCYQRPSACYPSPLPPCYPCQMHQTCYITQRPFHHCPYSQPQACYFHCLNPGSNQPAQSGYCEAQNQPNPGNCYRGTPCSWGKSTCGQNCQDYNRDPKAAYTAYGTSIIQPEGPEHPRKKKSKKPVDIDGFQD